MNEKIVVAANGYDRLDGRNAYHSDLKRMTLGAPALKENQAMQIAAQLWTAQEDGTLKMSAELPIHQIFDLMIVLSRTLLYFKEAYRLPLLYDPNNLTIVRLGLQGEALPVSICTENPNINKDIQDFSQALNDLGELTGERLRTLTRILKELECY